MDNNSYRGARDFARIHSEMTQKLAECYTARLNNDPGGSPGHSFPEFIKSLSSRDDPSVEDHMNIVRQFLTPSEVEKGDGVLRRSFRTPITLAAVFLTRSVLEHAVKKNQDAAWSYLSDACYWTAAASFSHRLVTAEKKDRIDRASKGAKGRNKKFEIARNKALDLLKSEMPSQGWLSIRDAAGRLKEKINKFAKDEGCGLEKKVSQKAIEEWFSKVPESGEIFRNQRNRVAKK